MRQRLNTFQNLILPAILNSYSVIFFFNNRFLAVVLMLVTFFNFYAGLSGLIAVVITVCVANSLGFDKNKLKRGLFSFNALLTGIGMGTFFDPGFVFFVLLALAALLTLILSVTLGNWLSKYGLPVLSLPFVFTFWFILLPSAEFENLGLTQRNIYWMNEIYSVGGNSLLHFFQTMNSLPLHKLVDTYFRSMSSIFFQDNLITGILIVTAILICSRITFSLTIIGFLSAYVFAHFSGSDVASINYYNIGANYVMVAIAVGGFFAIPSRYSYYWTVLLVPLTTLVLLFFSKIFEFVHLPVFSLPFSFVVILFVYFLQLRSNVTKLFLTPFQQYSPEANLYSFNNNKDRYTHFRFFPLYMPFWGEWTVNQGHNGEYTHKGDWGNAFDFVIQDEYHKTFKSNGLLCEDYYCYNKPILAPADGFIENVIDYIDDNEIGKVNTFNNWGNTIIIRHLNGLYTQMSHLKKGTFKFAKGEFVKRGDLVAHCGNSGRSPEPHLHFQVQVSPLLGSKTIDYPFGYYMEATSAEFKLSQFSKPELNNRVAGIIDNVSLKNAFELLPNTFMEFRFINEKGVESIEHWEAFTDAYNYRYLYCKETESTAYYVNNGLMFYFTIFYGDKNSLLYYFYLSAYKVFLGDGVNTEITDLMPLDIIRRKKLSYLIHDFIAPFCNFIRVKYSNRSISNPNQLLSTDLTLESYIDVNIFGSSNNESKSTITLKDNNIVEFTFCSSKIKINATCINT